MKVSEGCIDNLTWRLMSGHGQVLWSPEVGVRYLTSWRLDSDLWSTVCVIWGNVMDVISLDKSTLSHSDRLFLACVTTMSHGLHDWIG